MPTVLLWSDQWRKQVAALFCLAQLLLLGHIYTRAGTYLNQTATFLTHSKKPDLQELPALVLSNKQAIPDFTRIGDFLAFQSILYGDLSHDNLRKVTTRPQILSDIIALLKMKASLPDKLPGTKD